MRLESSLASEASEIETVAATGIQNNVARTSGHELRNSAQQRLRHTAIVQPAPRPDGCRGVAGLLGTPILRLEQINVPAPRDIKGMAARTDEPPLLTHQRHAAVTNAADQHASSVAAASLFVTQSHHWIHTHGAARWNISRNQRETAQQHGNRRVGYRIRRADAHQHAG